MIDSLARSTCSAGHPRTPENTYIRPDNGARVCKVCKRISDTNRRNGTRENITLRCSSCGNQFEWPPRTGRRPRRCFECQREHELQNTRKYVAEPTFRKQRTEDRARLAKLTELGERKERELAMLTLAKRSGELGKLYTQVIRAQQTLDRQPYDGREHNVLRGEAMRHLNEAEHALGSLLLFDKDKAAAS